MTDVILVLNAGSTSLKFAVYDAGAATDGAPPLLCHGQVEGLDEAPHFLLHTPGQAAPDEHVWDVPLSQDEATRFVITRLEAQGGGMRVVMAGHRIVMGGEHDRPVLATPEVLDYLDSLAAFEPSHQRYNVAGVRALLHDFGHIPQVCCFDTAFHRTMPDLATAYALPKEIRGLTGVRHWGFHGISYDYISREVARIAPDARRVIACHLGGGTSMCAMRDGASIETTMQFGALSGLPMATRAGDVPPELIFYLQRAAGFTPDRLEQLLYHESGLKGLSGVSGDMRVLEESTDADARFAIDHFVYAMTKYAGAYTALLGGLDALVFTGGIGEHSALVRGRLCGALGWLGVALDEAANAASARRISAPDSRVAVYAIPTDEEAMIARHTLALAGRP